jgi:hypothetical protein
MPIQKSVNVDGSGVGKGISTPFICGAEGISHASPPVLLTLMAVYGMPGDAGYAGMTGGA